MDSDARAHSDSLAALGRAYAKVEKAQSIIGEESAANYRQDLEATGKTLSSAPTLEELAAAKEKLSALDAMLTAEIAAKAVGEPVPSPQANVTQPPPGPQPAKQPAGLPCVPALILLISLCAAFGRENHPL